MTTNPLLSDEELAVRRRDPFIVKLNSGGDYSLLTNPGSLHRGHRHVSGSLLHAAQQGNSG